ncbi:phosphatase 2C-like domain-containing protein [Ochromonadaceae sp. CCMP2298]|nr:phosphatase 2C-like domain-containing protein [Ochromonadaceae sp. CCMP2298]
MHKWLFCFQKSVALVLSHLLSHRGGKRRTHKRPEGMAPELERTSSVSGDAEGRHLHNPRRTSSSVEGPLAPPEPWDGRSESSSDKGGLSDRDLRLALGRSSLREGLCIEGAGRPEPGLGWAGAGRHSHNIPILGLGQSLGLESMLSREGPGLGQGRSYPRGDSPNSAREERNSGSGRMAGSYKEEDDSGRRVSLQALLRSDSESDQEEQVEGRRSTPSLSCSSKDSHSLVLEEDLDVLADVGDASDSEYLMFEMDEQQQTRKPTPSKDWARADRYYFEGKALSLQMSMLQQEALASDPSRSPSRRSSHSASLGGFGAPSSNSPSLDECRSGLSNRGVHLMWASGFCSRVGPRNVNEDRFECCPNLGGLSSPSKSSDSLSPTPSAGCGGGEESGRAFFAVYDGHGGQQAADYISHRLLDNICQHPLYTIDLQGAVADACRSTDAELLSECDRERFYSGTTALGAFITGSELLVFNIGDCQAVLCRAGEALDLSEAHKPGRRDEAERIRRAGGWVTEERELYMGRLHRMDLSDSRVAEKAAQVTWTTINRVCGEISVSRSLGDPDYKRFAPGQPVSALFCWPEGHPRVFHADLLIPDPEFIRCQLSAGDEFLVLASDGLWDVVSSDEAVSTVREAFARNRTPTEACEQLCEMSIKLGSSDNVTVVIARFIHSGS